MHRIQGQPHLGRSHVEDTQHSHAHDIRHLHCSPPHLGLCFWCPRACVSCLDYEHSTLFWTSDPRKRTLHTTRQEMYTSHCGTACGTLPRRAMPVPL